MPQESFSNFETEKRGEYFEDQFNQREKIKVAGGTAEVVDVTPENLQDEVPVFLAPAWGCTIDIYKNAIEKLVECDRRVISLNHPRLGGDISEAPEEALEKYPHEQVRKALNILGTLNSKEVPKIDAIAHSEGAVNLMIAAMLNPEKFRDIVLYAPAGLIGEDKFTRLIEGFSKQDENKLDIDTLPMSEERKSEYKEAHKNIERFMQEFLPYVAKNPIRSLREARDISKSQIHDLLRFLHQEKGIKIAVMAGTEDPVFPMERIQDTVTTDMLDGFLSVRGGHGELGDNPELYMVAAAEMLEKLKEKSIKHEVKDPV